MPENRKTALGIINSLSGRKLEIALDYLLYLKSHEEWEATKELYDKDILSEIVEGVRQIEEGDFVKFEDIRRTKAGFIH